MEKQKADKIITEYLQKIYGFAVKKSFSFDEAEDLGADIVSEVYTSLLKSEDIVNIEGYIWRISRYTYSKYVSRKKKLEGVSIDNVILPYYEDYSLEEPDEELFRLRRESKQGSLSSYKRRTFCICQHQPCKRSGISVP